MIDSHCHLASHKFTKEELPELMARAREAGVERVVSLATSLDDLHPNLEIAGQHDEVRCCIGIHPCDVHETPDEWDRSIAPLLSDPRVCGVGETGLDYFHPAPEGWSEQAYRDRQKAFLTRHFELAAEAGLNVVIHTRDRSGQASFEDAMTIYEKFSKQVRAVFHCFIFDEAAARSVIALGGLVSFTGIATFKKAEEFLAVASALPAGSFMVETDAPYLAPTPHRGKRNEPAFVTHTARALADARRESLEVFAAHTTSAARLFFKNL